MKRFLSLFLVFIMVLGCFVSCKVPPTNEELIAERIGTFLAAYNAGDMQAVLECFDAETRTAVQAMLNLMGGLTGALTGFTVDLSDLFSLGIATAPGDFTELQIADITVADNKNAIATTTMTLTGEERQTIYFVMVYENGGWYIHNMTDEQIENNKT